MRILVLGCFDLTHAGHFDHFKRARQQGDELHVGVAHDSLVRAFKGPGRPIFLLPDRCAIIQACRYVTSVKVYGNRNSGRDTNEADMKALVEEVQPHIFCEGQDSAVRGGVLPGYLEELGVKRVVFPTPLTKDTNGILYTENT